MTQTLTIFDLDETLVAGDTSMLWHQFLVDKNIATEPNFLEQDRELMRLYARGDLDMQDYIKFSLKPLARVNISNVDALVLEFVSERIKSLFYPQGVSLIQQLKASQGQLLIISATASFIVKPVAKQLGVSHVLGVDLVKKDQCYTGEIDGVPTYREGKVTRLKEWLKEQKHRFDAIHFYSDSINDLPLLNYSDNAFVVNPCPKLKIVAEQESWPQLLWQR